MFRGVNFEMFLLLILWCLGNYSVSVLGHGMILEPPNRSSVWRFSEFKEYNATENWADNELFCGGFDTENHNLFNDGRCGVCGDNFSDPVPRANEDGGIYGQGIIVREYKSGEVIPIVVNLTTSHWGYFEIRLCAKDGLKSHLDESCYKKHLLEIISASNKDVWVEKTREAEAEADRLIKLKPGNSTGATESVTTKKPVNIKTKSPKTKSKGDKITKFYVTIGISHPFEAPMQYEFKVRLPKGIRCKNCVMQWQYTTGSNWGTCPDGTEARGCGPQETFRNCVDVAIA